ncbi:SulP family inorganic anion transporter [Paenibacillus elgii]|uniref:SulP family inorganic anion transporter n=1 Tax=Paenibacillus elgii TaxID=189691 RepID=UPI00204172D1|nr:SulP family inorganic anion transporter [Paenibacillus elgii]MCM3274096.1 SulP family inorganic anion transporter [Paenibacillus elgii]
MKRSGRFDGYSAKDFRRDLISGSIVGVIAIPLGMAFAIAAGVKPQYGIYTTVIAGFLISLLGGSKFQIGGPTGAFVPILFAIVMQYGYENLLIAGGLAGIILVLMGVFKLGALIQFIPRPVTIGFTAGIAVIIFTGQIANFLGLSGIRKHEDFISNMKEIGLHLSTVNLYSVLTAVVCLALLLATPKLLPRVPGSLVGLLVSSVLSVLLFEGRVDTIGSTYGAIPGTLPQFHIPDVTLEKVIPLLGPACIIAALGGIESLLSAVVADGMTGSRHHSNRELIGQGIANIVTPLFGGIPATGAIARTAANIKNRAASPVSGMVHSVFVLLVLIVLAPLASAIPLASMAPILMIVAWNMSERREFAHIVKTRTADSVVLIITFLLTVLTDLTTAVIAGLILAVVLFVRRMSGMLKVAKVLPDPTSHRGKVASHIVNDSHDCPQIAIITVEGALFFGAGTLFEKSISGTLDERPKTVILRLGKVLFMDTTGESYLAGVVRDIVRQGGIVLISGLQSQPRDVLKRTGLDELIGKEHFFAHTGEAIDFALSRLEHPKCVGCRHFAFRECTALSQPNTASER